uniref:Component of oligomeric Golgi complex 6 n=1 Tax=Gongylonema pulchrum TaxID=637853 RepID=A0A183EZ37_9BILA
LLLKLGVQSSAVYSDFLASCRRNLNDQLSTIQSQKQEAVDVLEFVDNCCSAFLADLSLVTALSQRFFPNQARSVEEVNSTSVIETPYQGSLNTSTLNFCLCLRE